MPRLNCTFGQVIDILVENGFVCIRHDGVSHRRYRGMVDGKPMFVDVAGHKDGDRPKPGTLKSMIRQSGLPERLFRR